MYWNIRSVERLTRGVRKPKKQAAFERVWCRVLSLRLSLVLDMQTYYVHIGTQDSSKTIRTTFGRKQEVPQAEKYYDKVQLFRETCRCPHMRLCPDVTMSDP